MQPTNSPCHGDTEEDLEQPHESQEPRLSVHSDPNKDEDETEDCQHGILSDNTENHISNNGSHEVVRVDEAMRRCFGLVIHFIKVLLLDVLLPLLILRLVFVLLLIFRDALFAIFERSSPKDDTS